MTTHVKLFEAAQHTKLEKIIDEFLNTTTLPSLKTAIEEKTLSITVSHSETVGGYNRPEPRYMAVIMWSDIM